MLRLTDFVIKNNKLVIVTIVKNNDPADPEIVLLGLILVSLTPLNKFPKIYPPMSEAMQPNKRIKINNLNSK
tara:strand:- start:259 stop:474 length:216 start_codon:yes stop_codon:yes gene_type:complete